MFFAKYVGGVDVVNVFFPITRRSVNNVARGDVIEVFEAEASLLSDSPDWVVSEKEIETGSDGQ